MPGHHRDRLVQPHARPASADRLAIEALLFGVGAAVAFGFGDYAAAMASRRAGVALTALGMQVLGVVAFAVVLLVLGRWPAFSMTQVPWAFVLALVGTLSLAALYRAFALGPIAVVSPVVASYAALSVVGIVLFLGERLTAGQVVAIAVTFVGVVIASTDVRELRRTLGRPVEGVRIGVLATIGFGIWGTILAAATRVNEPFALVIIWRLFGIALVALFIAWRRTPLAPLAIRSTLAIVALVGVLDTGANVLLMLGVESGFASFVMTGSGAYPIIPAVLAILVLRERLAPNQYVGVAVLVAGLVALGLQS
ncbi:MAG TPA: DMT family transporter [Candidatus Acidoferrales bacterium]|nr:DMT family transporter [Candidatus Acidoferrales bacterium]